MYLPDYRGGSIVNLMSSIGNALGAKMPYPELRIFNSNKLKDSKNVVLFVVDGLGYEYLKNHDIPFLKQNLLGQMTSVFLPTTACGVTTFLTGVAPQQHALTGWNTQFREIGMVAKILPFTPRLGGLRLNERRVEVSDLMDQKPFSQRIKVPSYVVQPKELIDTSYTNACSKKAKQIGYYNGEDLFNKIKKILKSGNKRKYIFVYIPNFDGHCHDEGTNSKNAEKFIKKLDKMFKTFAKKLEKQKISTTAIITADHGLITTPHNKEIWLKDHPKMMNCMSMSFSGEGRTRYCYIYPDKAKEFEDYVKTNLSNYCYLFKSRELIAKNLFGLGIPNPKLFHRIGDYTLIMKENYIFRDLLIGESDDKNLGHHGGVSKEEMHVPLIVFNT